MTKTKINQLTEDQLDEKYSILLGQLIKRGWKGTEFVDDFIFQIESDPRDAFVLFCQNEYEAEKVFTIACLKYFWKEIPTICSYLFTIKPC